MFACFLKFIPKILILLNESIQEVVVSIVALLSMRLHLIHWSGDEAAVKLYDGGFHIVQQGCIWRICHQHLYKLHRHVNPCSLHELDTCEWRRRTRRSCKRWIDRLSGASWARNRHNLSLMNAGYRCQCPCVLIWTHGICHRTEMIRQVLEHAAPYEEFNTSQWPLRPLRTA